MFYIEETDNELVKYEVELDIEKLSSLKVEIIDNCSKISHHCYESDYRLTYNFFQNHDIRNYHFTEKRKKKDYFEELRNIYKIEYDEYEHPLIVGYIDSLLKGETSVISSLKSYSSFTNPLEKARISENEAKSTLIKYLNKPLEEIKVESLTQSIHTLSRLKEDIIINQNQKSVAVYYDDVMKCITLTEVDRIDKDAIRKVEEFKGASYTKKGSLPNSVSRQ